MGRPRLPRGALVVPLLVASGLVGAAPASASTLTLTGAGTNPAIAVDDAGTGHIVWDENANPGDDRLIYCRLPRGASACATTQAFDLPAEDFDGPRVVLGGGEVVLLSHRCCFNGFPRNQATFALRSTDGGTSFGAPVAIANNGFGLHGDAIYGPGAFQIATVDSITDGTFFQAAPLGTPSPGIQARAQLDDVVAGPTGDTGDGTVALVDPLTPIAAFRSIQSDGSVQSFARLFGGTGDYNSVGNWKAPIPLGPAAEPRLAGGPRGAYLMLRTGPAGKERYVARRFDQLSEQFVDEAKLSAKGDPAFGDLIEDAGGHLAAIWIDNKVRPNPLLLTRSADGASWSEPKKLATPGEHGFDLNLAASGDGGGWVTWSTESGGGAVKAAPFAPLPAGGGDVCVPEVPYGKVVVAVAKQGCFLKQGSEYTIKGGVRINGIDLFGDGKITIDKGPGTLTSTGKVLVRAGNVDLDKEKLGWRLPKQAGQLKDLAGNPEVFDAAKFGAEFLRLPVSGYVVPKLVAGEATELPVNLKLPFPFDLLGGAATVATIFHLDNAGGLTVGGNELRADSVYLGIAEVKHLLVKYVTDPAVLQGEATIRLPVVGSELETKFGLADGAFDYGNAILKFYDPQNPFDSGLPIAGEFAFLRDVGFDVTTDPIRIAGTTTASGGPSLTIGGTPYAALLVNGSLSYTFSDPGVFNAHGSGDIFFIPDVANADITFITSGKLSLAGRFTVEVGSFELADAAVNGEVNVKTGAFNLSGTVEACGIPLIPVTCISGIDILVSSKAAVACTEYDPPGPVGAVSVGLAYRWGKGFDELFSGCHLSSYKDALSSPAPGKRGAAGDLTVEVDQRLPQVNFAIQGDGAAPRVTVTGPNGETVSSAEPPATAASGAAGVIGADEVNEITHVALPRPAKGTWTIAPLPGSAPIAGVMRADGLAEPNVKARVRRAGGRKRTLTYSLRRNPGQEVTFYETGPESFGRIGVAAGKRGELGFTAADGPRGRRTIEARVESFGLPREAVEVATYTAPGPIKPGKPRKLRLRRRGTKLLVGWRQAASAKRYLVATKLKDGRRIGIVTKRTRAKLKNVPGIDAGQIRVVGLTADNTRGKAAKARLKAKPKRHRHGGR